MDPSEHPAVAVDTKELLQVLRGTGGSARLLSAQSIVPLCNGVQIFPPMLDAIKAATREICFETFIYWSGDIARQFADALSEAAKRGVVVNIVLDWVGALKMDDGLVQELREHGAEVRYFNALRWWNVRRFNHRTHRKILVVDGEVGFTGGVGIAEQWTGDARGPEEWHDTHYRIEGPLVRPLRQAFFGNWSRMADSSSDTDEADTGAAGETPDGEDRPPDPGRADGDGAMGIISVSSPEHGHENAYAAFHLAIESARRRLRITTAYFVPDEDSRRSLCRAAERGVEVEVIVPGEYLDHQVVRFASRAHWDELLDCGVKIYIYGRTMLHAKSLLVDDRWLIVGSANFDNRSFQLNDELNLHVFDSELIAWHARLFETNLQDCHALTRDEWSQRPLKTRLLEWLSDHLRHHL